MEMYGSKIFVEKKHKELSLLIKTINVQFYKNHVNFFINLLLLYNMQTNNNFSVYDQLAREILVNIIII